jgi:hypothetical protein
MTETPELPSELISDAPSPTDLAEEDRPTTGRRTYGWIVWAIGIVVFLGYVLLARVHTRLGVEAPSWDKDGQEYVWRSWWRARHEIVDIGPSGFQVVLYAGLAIAFVILGALACWIALVADEPAESDLEPDSPNLR